MQIHFLMKTTSPYLTKAAMILVALFVTATAWWAGWKQQESAKQAEHDRAANEKRQEVQKWQEKLGQQSGILQKTIQEAGTIEAFAKPRSLNTWNGPTDPDHVWHEQRQRANQTLMRHGLPALDKQSSLPDSPALPWAPRTGGQK
jgi:ABC-type nickel/cobalt efflux system permease component RcnA